MITWTTETSLERINQPSLLIKIKWAFPICIETMYCYPKRNSRINVLINRCNYHPHRTFTVHMQNMDSILKLQFRYHERNIESTYNYHSPRGLCLILETNNFIWLYQCSWMAYYERKMIWSCFFLRSNIYAAPHPFVCFRTLWHAL